MIRNIAFLVMYLSLSWVFTTLGLAYGGIINEMVGWTTFFTAPLLFIGSYYYILWTDPVQH